MVEKKLCWGTKVMHEKKGEGIIIKDNNISLVKVVFRKNDEIAVFKDDTDELRIWGGEF